MSGFCINDPAQWHTTDTAMYSAPLAAPVPHITAPAQPYTTEAVMYTALFYRTSTHGYNRRAHVHIFDF